MGGRIELGGSHSAASSGGPESDRGTESADLAEGLRRGHEACPGVAGRPNCPGRPFLGGTVISEVGTDPKVTSLVYIAARAPDANEDFVALSAKFPPGAVRAGIVEHGGLTTLSEEAFLKYFANGVASEKAKVLYAVQWPTAASIFAGRTTAAAWRSKPSWYAVSKDDQTINPDLERFLAKRMNAATVELDAGHLSLVSHPEDVAKLILAAAGQGPS